MSRRTEPRDAEAPPRRAGVVDLGSNSVRLVVFEGLARNPSAIFNEKAILGLGRGLQASGKLNEDAIAHSILVLERYVAVARSMGADPLEVLATAAVRDATNGEDYVAMLRRRFRGLSIRVLTGQQEAQLSAEGVLCGIPDADGVLGDLGGGSLELVHIRDGAVVDSATLPLGVIRLSEQAGGDVVRARAIAEEALISIPWLREGAGRDLYLVGGAWRALARIHIGQTGYPLAIVHHYTLPKEEARDLTSVVTNLSKRTLERIQGLSRRRVDGLPFAAVVLRRLLRVSQARRVVFSANGMREGWFAGRLPPAVRAEDPLIAAGRELNARFGRGGMLPPELVEWTAPLFPTETPQERRLREAACWVSDIGAHEHPDYKAEQAFLRMLRQPGIGLDHHARAFLALVVAMRHEAEPDQPWLAPARVLLDAAAAQRAEIVGAALRLAYTLSGGSARLLALTGLRREGGRLVLRLSQGGGVFAGDSVWRRLERLAELVGAEPGTEIAPPPDDLRTDDAAD
ncbi:Ppx/GppA phosphatase family protein [Elioraea rosea]|uniref:Ppx/GppA phosphatase family protein n=1 Tax=Elioraea rosea TaxID=2492390 RepID=UPI001EF72AC4|nr:Ppx/GppA family phosphatase [Elioraea rosea]